MFKGFLRTAIATTALAIGISTASAAPFGLKISDTAVGNANVPAVFVSDEVWREIDITITGDQRYTTFGAGLFKLEVADLGIAGPWQPLNTFCLEILQDLGGGSNFSAETIASALAGSIGNEIRRLWAEEFVDATSGIGADSKDRAAAFQIAVWEIMDGRDGLDGGDFILHTTDAGLLAKIADFLAVAVTDGPLADLGALTDPLLQDQLFLRTPGGPGGAEDPVPAPATLALFGAALAGLGVARRRKQG